MKVALVERFASPSRRCARELVTEPDDEVVVWDLAPQSLERMPTGSDMVRAFVEWLRTGAPVPRVWRYARAAWNMRGGRRTSLLRLPAWIRAARSGEIDAVICFSTDHFDVARLLAEDAGVALREQLENGTQYFGEFAFELLAVVPYAYWLHQQGRLEVTVSTEDTRALYYFSPRHLERSTERRYVPITEYPVGERGATFYDQPAFPTQLDTTRWSPPPYRAVYRDERFEWAKPTVVVGNKTSDEPFLSGDGPVNTIPTDTLLELVGRLTSRYTVVYNRPRETDMVGDHGVAHEVGDIAAVTRAFPEVVTIQALLSQHPELGYNELQLRLYARCERFVSVLGGGSYLASWFGGTNIVFAQQGWEVDCGAYEHWFSRFSGARVVAVATPDELLRAVDAHFVRDG
jgi:hypothetical protein